MIRALLLAAAAASALTGCERASQQLDAAEDVRAFLLAVRTRDRDAFERHVDRAAVQADLQRQARARPAGDPAAALLASAEGRQLVDRLITPETFDLAVRSTPLLADRTPSAPEIAAVLRTLDAERVCLPSGGPEAPCAVTFTLRGDTWKLSGVNAGGFQIQNLPFPPSASG